MIDRIGFFGFGEVSYSIAKGILGEGYDGLIYSCDLNKELLEIRKQDVKNLVACENIDEMLDKVNIIFAALPCSINKNAFLGIKKSSFEGYVFIDLSSSLPNDKKMICDFIEDKKGVYIDGSIMGAISALQHKTPMIFSGLIPDEIYSFLTRYNFSFKFVGTEVGYATTVKLCRSIFMKGLPALFLETIRVSERYGVRDQVISSVSEDFKNQSFFELMNRLVNGAYKHSKRQLDELYECKEISDNAGVVPNMTCSSIKVFETIINEKDL